VLASIHPLSFLDKIRNSHAPLHPTRYQQKTDLNEMK
jgi:hypothetical protein